MKNVLLLVLLLSTLSLSANAQVSAARAPNQSYLDIANSRLKPKTLKYQYIKFNTAYSARLVQPDLSKVAEWKNGDINQAFEAIRDERFMKDTDDFSRRPTWLYPYDGCYARAEVAVHRLMMKGSSEPSKIFIYGDLAVKSPNASETVTWWYHVAVAYRYKESVYIFDPAMSPKKLLKLEEWKALMGSSEKEISICSKGAYDPDSNCDEAIGLSYEMAQSEQAGFFEAEKENILDLGRNPETELGENPPWKK